VSSLSLAVLGDPIDHSLSPRIHGAALRALELEGTYVPIRADRARLEEAVADLRSGTLDGINITMPLKQAAYALSDRLTDEAARAGSVNTMRPSDGVAEGHSSDLIAVAEGLERLEPLGNAPVLVLGAGGAAAAAGAAVTGRQLYFAARSAERSTALSARVTGSQSVGWGVPVASAIVVNATPVGVGGDSLPNGLLEASSGLIDLPYARMPTSSVTTARSLGIPTIDGIEFLVAQACVSFRWWTGIDPPADVMLAAARNT
jgi:shikimate dehydrogenase